MPCLAGQRNIYGSIGPENNSELLVNQEWAPMRFCLPTAGVLPCKAPQVGTAIFGCSTSLEIFPRVSRLIRRENTTRYGRRMVHASSLDRPEKDWTCMSSPLMAPARRKCYWNPKAAEA